ncbi:G-patch-domain-containing protein [Tothia fuscella]|uniref:G-patch-domain-containing protein n=1 Tax=Tothia fuscella TaxID=1048955 RepID=A0A9P4P2X9_9PEZI|nr:G-patch-domain-containing protein [Tothia fuscella]
MEDNEEDDYMNMIIAEPARSEKETSIQRTARKRREARERGFHKTKQEREADAAAARDAALSTSLNTSNKGFKMMAKLGYKPGTTLGKAEHARIEPIGVVIKENRGGIGHDSEKKRKIRGELEEAAKRVKVEEVGYRERVRQEREEKRVGGQLVGAQKIAEGLDMEADQDAAAEEDDGTTKDSSRVPLNKRPLGSINVLWRGLIKSRLEKDVERRMRADMQQSLSRLPTYDNPTEEQEDRDAYAKKQTANEFVEEDLFDEDAELNEFQELDAGERLDKVVMYLRKTYHYCFWCKHRYENTEMEGCPGLTEEEHD